MIFGIDISSFQSGLDLAEVRREGFDFCFIKVTEGAGYVNPAFGAQLSDAQDAGLIVAAYHYVLSDPPSAQVANVNAHLPRDLPIIIDAENGAGNIDNIRAVTDGLRAAGYVVPLLYLPQWYWQQIGRPSLDGFPPLWSSKYWTTNPAPASTLYEQVPGAYWSGYGGLPVVLLQFTDAAQVARQKVDASAFGGSRDQLAALLGGAPATTHASEESVATIMLPATDAPADPHSDPSTWPRVDYAIALAPPGGWHGQVMAHVLTNAYYDHDPRVSGYVRFGNWFVEPGQGGNDVTPVAVADGVNDNGVPMVRFWAAHWGPAPTGASSLVLNYAAPGGGSVTLEYEH